MLVPIESKQIAFAPMMRMISDAEAVLSTGDIVMIPSVHKSEYQSVSGFHLTVSIRPMK